MMRRAMDLSMMVYFGSREFGADDWVELFRRADPGYRVVSVRVSSDGTRVVVVAEWMGSS